ncbi:MAG TPA: hypothetical protein VEC01_12670 [Noviherbaspirillum sp.]|uniref:hypothetical protein n=1 Tax=Noviherbaspirillum sp. TaxID=1926288 RepID=UPI002D399530|nr:hypothetical protein [Noviherbaspirillum sp.]HYD96173.1 hypothetical protein [Noviherbaspirillum sp.]
MKTTVLKRCIAPVLLLSVMQAAAAAETYWVAVPVTQRYTCPSLECGSVGLLREGDKVEVLELKSGWARITEQYDAKCVNGRTALVEDSNNQCNAKNGIPDGTLAEWVRKVELSKQKTSSTSHKH